MGISSNLSHFEEEDEGHIFDNPYIRAALIAVYSIVFFFCFFGNLTVILVTAFHWRMRSVTKFCLGNLAFANFCVGVFCVYQNLSLHLFSGWIFGKLLCKMYHFTNSLSHTASVLILVVISAERYMAILHPFRCRQILTLQRLRFIIGGVWILSAILSSPRLYSVTTMRHPFYKKQDLNKVQVICVPSSAFVEHLKIADTFQFLLLFLIPMIIISVLYSRVAVHLRQRDKYRSHLVNGGTLFESSRRRRNNKSSKSGSSASRFMRKNSPGSTRSSRSLGVDPIEGNAETSSEGNQQGEGQTAALNNDSRNNNGEVGDDNSGKDYPPGNSMVRFKFSRKPIRNKTARASNNQQQREQFRYNTRVTTVPTPHKPVVRMLVTVVIAFAVCNLPFHLRKMYQNWAPKPHIETDFSEILIPISFLMMYANCAINPFLYGFASKSFRACLVDFAKCRLRKPTQSLQ